MIRRIPCAVSAVVPNNFPPEPKCLPDHRTHSPGYPQGHCKFDANVTFALGISHLRHPAGSVGTFWHLPGVGQPRQAVRVDRSK